MLIVIILIALLPIWLSVALPRRQLNSLLKILLITSLWTFIWLVLLQYELQIGGSTTGTYGSDATYYYNAMYKGYYSGNPSQAISAYYNQLYIWFGIILLKASPFFSVVWVKIGNIALLLYVISIMYVMLYRAGVSDKVTNFVCLFAGINGIVTWMCIRNLKDTLFLFLFIFNCFIANSCYTRYKIKKNMNIFAYFIFFLIITIGLSVCFKDIRHWAYIIPWLILISLLVRILVDNKNFNYIIPGVCIVVVAFFSILIPNVIGYDLIEAFQAYASKIGLGGSSGFNLLKGLVVGFMRFIIGPGPIRAIMGNDVFLVTTNIGNTLIFLGALTWWLAIPLLILRIKELILILPKGIVIFAPFLAYVFIYVYSYQGSVETRFRALLYIISMLLWGLTYAYYQPEAGKEYNVKLSYIICVVTIFVLGTAATYLSLS